MSYTTEQAAFEVTVPNNSAQVRLIRERIIELLERCAYSTRDVFHVRLALEEAMVNAVKHGNQMNPDKSIRVLCSVGSECARFEIEDEGRGFCAGEVPDPTETEFMERPGGRGLLLMRSMMSSVEFSRTGNKVIMEKLREQCAERVPA